MEQQAIERQRSRSLGTLFGDLIREAQSLIHKEAELARAEVSEKISQVGAGAGSLMAGGLVAFAGLLILLEAAVLALALVTPGWLAALIVGGIVAIIGLAMVSAGRKKLKARNLEPRATMESLRRDKEFMKEHM